MLIWQQDRDMTLLWQQHHDMTLRGACVRARAWLFLRLDCQALDRLTSFKSRLKKRIWQDHRKIDWREENVRLQRASKELTKAIQVRIT